MEVGEEGEVVTPNDFIRAGRVPNTVEPAEFGPWTISRVKAEETLPLCGDQVIMNRKLVGFDDYTILHRSTWATLHLPYGDIVMEDSRRELRKHLPIWMAARGRVLVTGLGLGCVARGLLANDKVEHVTIIEKCPYIVEKIGPEFWRDPRVSLYLEDALEWRFELERFDFAWHDLWTDQSADEPHLQKLHAQLFIRYRRVARIQGAWAFPRELYRTYARRIPLIGGPNFRGRLSIA